MVVSCFLSVLLYEPEYASVALRFHLLSELHRNGDGAVKSHSLMHGLMIVIEKGTYLTPWVGAPFCISSKDAVYEPSSCL